MEPAPVETVYRSQVDENHIVMNERVQALAGSIYEEFEKMISKYDQDVVKNLMPLIVNVLESMDLAYTESQELEVEVELLKEDNEQLVTQYEREKQLRKCSEQKVLELEDVFEGERKDLTVKIDSLSSIVKMFELKVKNSHDAISRLEDKESEQKKDYTKLHERYTDLFKTHMDYMERTKNVIGSDRMEQLANMGTNRARIPSMSLNQLNRSSGPVSYGYSELENNNQASITTGQIEFGCQTPNIDYNNTNTSIKNELQSPGDARTIKSKKKMIDKGQVTDDIEQEPPAQKNTENNGTTWANSALSPETDVVDVEVAEDVSNDPTIGAATPTTPSTPIMCQSHTKSETRSATGNNLYQELSFHDTEALGEIDEGADLTGGFVLASEFASSDSGSENGENGDGVSLRSYDNGMGKEVENLIMENNELLATKNALNIVKDDLIAKVDELTGEHEILREEIKSLQGVRAKLQQKVQELEDALKVAKEENEKSGKKEKSDDEEEVPMAQRKRFTRVEMARVLMERNQYKERFMELQEAVRWTEMIRANKSSDPQIDRKNSKGIWKFFSNLFSGQERQGDGMSPYMNMKYSGSDEQVGPSPKVIRSRNGSGRQARGHDLFDGDSMSWNLRHPLISSSSLNHSNTSLSHTSSGSSRLSHNSNTNSLSVSSCHSCLNSINSSIGYDQTSLTNNDIDAKPEINTRPREGRKHNSGDGINLGVDTKHSKDLAPKESGQGINLDIDTKFSKGINLEMDTKSGDCINMGPDAKPVEGINLGLDTKAPLKICWFEQFSRFGELNLGVARNIKKTKVRVGRPSEMSIFDENRLTYLEDF